MPFIQRSVSYLGGASSLGGKRFSGNTDEDIAIDIRDTQSDLILESIQGNVGLQKEPDRVRFKPKYAGAYILRSSGSPPLAQIAVNHNLEESDIRVTKPLIEVAASIEPERFVQKYSLVRWLLWGILGLLFLQALISTFSTVEDEHATA